VTLSPKGRVPLQPLIERVSKVLHWKKIHFHLFQYRVRFVFLVKRVRLKLEIDILHEIKIHLFDNYKLFRIGPDYLGV
jgi:hypothetical protein